MNNELFSLTGRRAVVTGGGRGLGKAIAAGLASAGATVVVVSRTAADVESAAAELGANVHPLSLDVASGAAGQMVDAMEKAAGGAIDIVVHAAGVQHRQPAEEFDAEAWDHVLRVNLTAPFALSQEIGRRQLAGERGGSHIFVGSLTSLISVPDVAAYTASKSGVYGLVRNLSTEWSSRGIRVNGIGPGYFRTALTEKVFADEARYQKMLDRIPMGRFGNPEELAGTAVFLASDAASYLTGQLLMVDGGWTAS
ncbi:2-deoxy-D-gluconate 3-dehydrogenase [Arthrobacter sp. MYb224]|uniref:SDR family oxidoreductase n=1 Tax=Micrococcaceae TaxID=1268 RepID=UPI000CFDB992|nr:MULTISPECIES: SDR family oxidoreductase [unclassified Arthrobacter]PQZ97560.1 2-deoxy-D-gluconate 3-dehydrogenase [Arthrobacter sp. MYb224]PRA04209.1 2-deoxy-D-gluconate 3-dehydrogenase [Arthrobacter sp. MYb229]PRB51879.1 2-deoxy-D-gluconate 3-dehydrogenase [Arthrobacter sp. MYb216]